MHESAVFQVLVCNPCSARSLARLIPRNDDDDDVVDCCECRSYLVLFRAWFLHIC